MDRSVDTLTDLSHLADSACVVVLRAQGAAGVLHALATDRTWGATVLKIANASPVWSPKTAEDRALARRILNRRDASGRTPLLVAAQEGAHCVAWILLCAPEVDVTAADADGDTSLHAISETKVTKRLIKRGADVNARNAAGFPPLAFAPSTPSISVLVRKGADASLPAPDGDTCVHVLARRCRAQGPLKAALAAPAARAVIDQYNEAREAAAPPQLLLLPGGSTMRDPHPLPVASL